ncbi:uncharacterized protein LOC132560697 [Ylistrum balloti]|uniref:uncharacterized protein LOC132560697 n=1 Tax=Ylistrum balloti TaxID=509963 RepID=UPI002905B023|nr:uncharacterized protein LOC132560697 [Ylistrum balloti]
MNFAVFFILLTVTFADVHNDLLSTLNFLHESAAYQALPPELKGLTEELASTAQTGQLTAYIDKVGFSSVLSLLRHLPVDEAHDVEDYLLKVLTDESIAFLQAQQAASTASTQSPPATDRMKRSLRSKSDSYLHNLESTNAYQSLPQEYKGVLKSLLTAAYSNTLTQFIGNDVNILPRLLHHMNPGLARRLNAYFIQQLRTEAQQHDDDDD